MEIENRMLKEEVIKTKEELEQEFENYCEEQDLAHEEYIFQSIMKEE